MKFFSIIFFLLVSMSGCVTPMSASEVDEMTTCKGVTLAEVRKQMLLHGFTIDKETLSDIVTEFKQIDNRYGDRQFLRVTAVDVGDNTVKLKVRVKFIRIYRDDHFGMGFSTYDRRPRQSNSVILDFSRPIEVEDEEDQSYVEEHRSSYLQLRQDVCGF